MPVILVDQKAEIRRIAVQGEPGQKISETSTQQKKGGCGGAHLSSQLCQNEVGGSQSRLAWAKT
jgi:hypothetical protein